MVYVSFSFRSSSWVNSEPSTHLPNSHEWHVREAACCHLPYLGLNLLINREQMAAILLSTWPHRDTRHCCFKKKRYKSSNKLFPQVLNFHDREKSGHRPLPPSWTYGDRAGLTFKDVLELMLLQTRTHGLFDGTDVFVELDYQRVIIHTFHVGNDGIVPLLCKRDEIMETVNPGKDREMGRAISNSSFWWE